MEVIEEIDEDTNAHADEADPACMLISKITDQIYLGPCEPAVTDSDSFQKLNIDVIINCASDVEYPPQTKYIIENYPMEDDDCASMLDYMDDANEKIHHYLRLQKKVYLHCVMGVSRSPAILIYYMMSHMGLTYDEAYDQLIAIRPVINLNHNFERELRTIEEVAL